MSFSSTSHIYNFYTSNKKRGGFLINIKQKLLLVCFCGVYYALQKKNFYSFIVASSIKDKAGFLYNFFSNELIKPTSELYQ